MKTTTFLLLLVALTAATAEVSSQGTVAVGFFASAATCTKLPADISGGGQGHIVFRTTLDNNGILHVGVTFNARGTASDANGNQYVFNDADSLTFSGPSSNGFEMTHTEDFHLIGKGGAPNVTVKALMHIRVTPNGDVTAFVEKASGNGACEGIV